MKSESFKAPSPPDPATTETTSKSLEGQDGPNSVPSKVKHGEDISIEVATGWVNRIPDLRTRVVVDLLANAGLSVKQVINLRWCDLDSYLDMPDESRLCARVANHRNQVVEIDLPEELTTRLKEFAPGIEGPHTTPILISRDRKFRNHAPTALTTRSVYQLVKVAFEQHVGISSITPRTLRAYFLHTNGKQEHGPPTQPAPFSPESFSEPPQVTLRCTLTDLWFPGEEY